jgi:hypothetical protein
MSTYFKSVAVFVITPCVSFLSTDDEPNAVFLHVSSADEGQKHRHQSAGIALLLMLNERKAVWTVN